MADVGSVAEQMYGDAAAKQVGMDCETARDRDGSSCRSGDPENPTKLESPPPIRPRPDGAFHQGVVFWNDQYLGFALHKTSPKAIF